MEQAPILQIALYSSLMAPFIQNMQASANLVILFSVTQVKYEVSYYARMILICYIDSFEKKKKKKKICIKCYKRYHTYFLRAKSNLNSVIVQGRGQSGVLQDVFIGFYLTEFIPTLLKRRIK